jgi:hypothetical protein
MSCGTYIKSASFFTQIYPQNPAPAHEMLTNKKIHVARLMLPKTPDKASCVVRVCDKALSPKNTTVDMSTLLSSRWMRKRKERRGCGEPMTFE